VASVQLCNYDQELDVAVDPDPVQCCRARGVSVSRLPVRQGASTQSSLAQLGCAFVYSDA